MSSAFQTVNLEELESVQEFSDLLESASAAAQTIVLLRDRRVVGTVVPAEMARQMFARTVAEHWARHPETILDLETRLRTETPEAWTD